MESSSSRQIKLLEDLAMSGRLVGNRKLLRLRHRSLLHNPPARPPAHHPAHHPPQVVLLLQLLRPPRAPCRQEKVWRACPRLQPWGPRVNLVPQQRLLLLWGDWELWKV